MWDFGMEQVYLNSIHDTLLDVVPSRVTANAAIRSQLIRSLDHYSLVQLEGKLLLQWFSFCWRPLFWAGNAYFAYFDIYYYTFRKPQKCIKNLLCNIKIALKRLLHIKFHISSHWTIGISQIGHFGSYCSLRLFIMNSSTHFPW